jgi:hypothetical protein
MFGKILLGRSVRDQQHEYEHSLSRVTVPVHPSTIRLCAYWENCQSKGGMRMGRDIPNRAIAPLLRHVTVAEPVGDWTDARLRLAGSGMSTHFGHDPSGRLMSELFVSNTEQLAMLLAGARAALAANTRGVVDHKVMHNGLVAMRNELVVLPVLPPEGDAQLWALVGTFAF